MSGRARLRRLLMLAVLLSGALFAVALGAGVIGAGALDAFALEGRADSAQTTATGNGGIQPPQDRFQHAKHGTLFPLCTTCHAGVVEPGQPMWPEPTRCAACHDGVVQQRVSWEPRTGPRAGNLRFTHEAHTPRRESRPCVRRNAGDAWLGGVGSTRACDVDRTSIASAWIGGDSGASTWQVMQKFCAWQVAQLAAMARGVPAGPVPFACFP
jgi:hypothetical protein